MVVDPFLKSTSNPPLSGLILALTAEPLPVDKHLVVAVAPGRILANTPFPGTPQQELDLIVALNYTTTVDRTSLDAPGQAYWDAQDALVGSFVAAVPVSYHFLLPTPVPGQSVGSPFDVVQFSDAQFLGVGIALVTTVPEPSALLMLLAGMAVIVPIARRRVKST